MRQEPHRLVLIDETGTTTEMTRLRGQAQRGQRYRARTPFGHWGTQTFVAALRHDGLTGPWIIDRPMNRQIFETWTQTQLAPRCNPAMSSSSTISPATKARRPTRSSATGAWFLFLPPYSPDLDPIEMAFAKFKAHLQVRRRANHR